MLAETKSRRCFRSMPPRRSHANPQSSAHLQLPSSYLAGAAGPATRRAYGLPGEKTVPRARRTKAAIPELAGRPIDRPQLREDLGPIGGTQQPEGRRHPRSCPPSSRHLEGLPGWGEAPRARRTKAATQEAQDSLGTAPPAPGAWDPLGEYYNQRAADGPPQQFPALPCIGSLTALEILPNPQSSALL